MQSIEDIKKSALYYLLDHKDKTFIAISETNIEKTQQIGLTMAWNKKKKEFDYSYGPTFMMNEYVDNCLENKRFDMTNSYDEALKHIKK